MPDNTNYDVASYDIITTMLYDLINDFPLLSSGDSFSFSVLSEDRGKAFFPSSGAIIESNIEDVLGGIEQICNYPFTVVYRAAGLDETRRAQIKEWLDNLGRWLEGQTITSQSASYKIEYPELTGDRKILSIRRTTPAYLDSINANKSENWAIAISLRYRVVY